jgi:ABC-2 type transport system ATP-binding protein
MKQRLSLARTLVHDPKVLILDEPASGLDPRARVEIRELMRELSRMGKTIFFSTHILSDVAEICTRVGIIENGEMMATGGIEDLQQLVMPHRQVKINILGAGEAAESLLQDIPAVSEINWNGSNAGTHTRMEFAFVGDDEALSGLLAQLVADGIRLIHFSEETRDLEEVFMRITKGLVS